MKKILDVCCGGRMFYFDKNNPLVEFCDIRNEIIEFSDERFLNINPNTVADFRKLPFKDNSYHLVIFDPPHLIKVGDNAWLKHKYGKLNEETWQEDLSQGFNECYRVLKQNGTLIFKWNECQIKKKQVLDLFPVIPLFGHTGASVKTHWYAFFKN